MIPDPATFEKKEKRLVGSAHRLVTQNHMPRRDNNAIRLPSVDQTAKSRVITNSRTVTRSACGQPSPTVWGLRQYSPHCFDEMTSTEPIGHYNIPSTHHEHPRWGCLIGTVHPHRVMNPDVSNGSEETLVSPPWYIGINSRIEFQSEKRYRFYTTCHPLPAKTVSDIVTLPICYLTSWNRSRGFREPIESEIARSYSPLV
ncbi:hypothetical protein EDD17DRAFT_848323 [Pisolithus thermaeus]|nr:hypothetical protein EDD17DRAFT_848323 [Pisolithus thermaeus]